VPRDLKAAYSVRHRRTPPPLGGRAQGLAPAAASYYARSFGSGITGLGHLHDVASNPNVIDAVVDRELADWASGHEDRIAKLGESPGPTRNPAAQTFPA
jgi:hypothetical protein